MRRQSKKCRYIWFKGNKYCCVGDVEQIVSRYFSGATIQEAVGIYEGEEDSIIVTIVNCCRWEDEIKNSDR